jgi:LPXTG-site transpeptidase (sortase) family protein
LEQNTKDYDFKFNMLPPTNRLMVPSLGVDDPIVISKYMDIKDFTNWNFDKELENWPVKYPTTPDPWVNGNTLIFGHTSQERRKKNPFGMTFAHIADLNLWDIIQVVRNGTLHEYKIINIVAVYPERVPEEYNKYTNLGKSYLTLMWCYPIWTATKRMLVTAEEQVKSQ